MNLIASIVVASAAKQSKRPMLAKGAPSMTAQLDCFAMLAMTVVHAAPVSCPAGGARRDGESR
jgi:hypothetical protein